MSLLGGNSGGRQFKITGEDETAQARVDPHNLALITMDEVHSNIHRGIFYAVNDLIQDLADNDSEELLIVASGVVHMRAEVATTAQAIVRFFENTTVSDVGSGLSSNNRNRISPNVSSRATVYRAPTIIDNGTCLHQTVIPGGTKSDATGSSSSTFSEWVLPSGNYLVRLTNNSGSAEDASIEIDYYEA